MTHKMLTTVLGLGLVIAPLAACGDDDDEAGDDEFCEIAADLAAQDETDPDDPLFDRYIEAAPDEIKDDAELAIARIGAEGDGAFDDPEVVAAVENIEAFEEEQCGITLDDRAGEGDEGDTDAGDTTDTTDATDATTDDTSDDTGGDETTTTTLEDTATTVTG